MPTPSSTRTDVQPSMGFAGPGTTTLVKGTAPLAFGYAMILVAGGGKVRRMEWPAGEYLFLRAGIVHLKNAAGEHVLSVSDGDINATDWIVIED